MFRAILAGYRAFLAESRRLQARRKAIRELADMPPHALRDLGIRTRSDIRAYVDGTLPRQSLSPYLLMKLREAPGPAKLTGPRLRLVRG